MNQSPYKQISQHMDQTHPGVTYKFMRDGIWIDQAVSTDWGTGVKLAFRGLVITYKREGTRLKKRDGSWSTDQIAVQARILDEFTDRDYIAQFGVGVKATKELIDSYLEGSS